MEETAPTMEPRKLPMPRVPRAFVYSENEFFYERACYDKYHKLIVTWIREMCRHITIAGTSGIGNTTFYAYCFDRFRRENPHRWVVAVSFWRSKLHGVAVYKGDGQEPQCHWRGCSDAMRDAENGAAAAGHSLIMFCDGSTSKNGFGRRIMFTGTDDEWINIDCYSDATHYMPLWTREELKEAARVLDLRIGNDAGSRDAEIDARFELFGGVAFLGLHEDPATIATATRYLHREVKQVYEPRDLGELLAGKPKRLRETQNLLVHSHVREDFPRGHSPRVASAAVLKMLAESVLAQTRRHRSLLHELVSGLPRASSLTESDGLPGAGAAQL